MNILAIYADNTPSSNKDFWVKIEEKLRPLPWPDILLGDFNITEDTIDRMPPCSDNAPAVEALQTIKQRYNLIDGWRRTFPTEHKYTFAQSIDQGGSQSRLDRIYIRDEAWLYSHDWEMQHVGIHTDHKLVTVYVSDKALPFIGPGHWTLPLHLLSNDIFIKRIAQMCIEAADRADAIESRSSELNIQTVFEELKSDI